MGLSLLRDEGARRLISRKVQSYKIGFIIIKGQGGTQAYKQKSLIHIKNGFIIIKG